MYTKNKEGENIKLIDQGDTINLSQSDTIATRIFSANSKYLTTYRIDTNALPSDLPESLKKYYHFIVRVGPTLAIDYCTNHVMYMITYVNNDLVFRRLETTTVTQ